MSLYVMMNGGGGNRKVGQKTFQIQQSYDAKTNRLSRDSNPCSLTTKSKTHSRLRAIPNPETLYLTLIQGRG
jgi:hypothetical protein